jgi:hypothetical protein
MWVGSIVCFRLQNGELEVGVEEDAACEYFARVKVVNDIISMKSQLSSHIHRSNDNKAMPVNEGIFEWSGLGGLQKSRVDDEEEFQVDNHGSNISLLGMVRNVDYFNHRDRSPMVWNFIHVSIQRKKIRQASGGGEGIVETTSSNLIKRPTKCLQPVVSKTIPRSYIEACLKNTIQPEQCECSVFFLYIYIMCFFVLYVI